MSVNLKKKIIATSAIIVAGLLSAFSATTVTAATGNTCSGSIGSWPCFASSQSGQRVAKKSFRAKRALSKRSSRRRLKSRAKRRSATLLKRRAVSRKANRRVRRSARLKSRYSARRTVRRVNRKAANPIIFLNKAGKRISKRAASLLLLKTKKRRNKRSKLRHSVKKKRTSYNRGFSLRGRHMRVTSASIKTSCFPTRLRGLIGRIERHYGKKLVVTSGYRSKWHNRRIGGASRSQHVHCKAVDFRIPGVNKYTLARYVRSMSGRGGVGTYCGKSTIHLDVGPRRTWNYCGRRKSRKRYAKRIRRSRSYRTTSRRGRKSWSRKIFAIH